jgi:SAM-dependent methyltransferase
MVDGELAVRPHQPLMGEASPRQCFVDRHGVSHPLDAGLRDRLKPGWRTMLDPAAVVRPPSDKDLQSRARGAVGTVRDASLVLTAVTGRSLTGSILEIGCDDGAVAFQLALLDGTEVVASDVARYYVAQQPGRLEDGDLQAQRVALSSLRERARHFASVPSGKVEFVEDDICASGLKSEGFDVIVSFEVLEHVVPSGAAFTSMARLLARGGVAYHEYNPFFSVVGGHSLCTLDMAWGHARLEPDDFERYLSEIRPAELDQALRFYQQNLNRMTLADLRLAVEQSGLELVALLPWTDRTLATDLTAPIVSEVQRAYPSARVEDLLATFVSVVIRKP